MRYLDTTEGRMFSLLLGGKGALARLHQRQAWSTLAYALAPDAASIPCWAQDAASRFIHKHGARAARAYARSLLRRRSA